MAKDKYDDGTANEKTINERERAYFHDLASNYVDLNPVNESLNQEFEALFKIPGALFVGMSLISGLPVSSGQPVYPELQALHHHLMEAISLCPPAVFNEYMQKVFLVAHGLDIIRAGSHIDKPQGYIINGKKVSMENHEYSRLSLGDQEELALFLGRMHIDIISKEAQSPEPGKKDEVADQGMIIVYNDKGEKKKDERKNTPDESRILELIEIAKRMPKAQPPKPMAAQPPKPMAAQPPKPVAAQPPKPMAAQPPKPMPAPVASPQLFQPAAPNMKAVASPGPKQILKDETAKQKELRRQRIIDKLTEYKKDIEKDLGAGKEYDFLGMGISKKVKLAVVIKLLTHLESNYSIKDLEWDETEQKALHDGQLNKIVSKAFKYDDPNALFKRYCRK